MLSGIVKMRPARAGRSLRLAGEKMCVMKKRHKPRKKQYEYEAPGFYVWGFYAVLAVWTVVSVYLLATKAANARWAVGQLCMIGFVLAYTWYWSLAISYRVTVSDEGDIEFKSFRRVLRLRPENINLIEGPRFSLIPTVFLRFRLAREKAYLFCVITDEELGAVLRAMMRNNRDMKVKGVGL